MTSGVQVTGLSEFSDKLDKIKERANDLTPIWNTILNTIREDFTNQLEQSKGPDGETYPKLKESTLSQPRRSAAPWDTIERESWNAISKGGTVNYDKNSMELTVDVKGDLKRFPIGISQACEKDILELIKEYVLGERDAD